MLDGNLIPEEVKETRLYVCLYYSKTEPRRERKNMKFHVYYEVSYIFSKHSKYNKLSELVIIIVTKMSELVGKMMLGKESIDLKWYQIILK